MKRRRASRCSVPVDRVSEMLFGLFMALTLHRRSVGGGVRHASKSARCSSRRLGCNLAWGLVDAVMYLVRTVTDRGRSLTLMHSVRDAPDARQAGRTLIERSLSRVAAGLVSHGRDRGDARADRRAALACRRDRALGSDDLLAALAIFLIVVARHLSRRAALCADRRMSATAKNVSRGIALAMLFFGGLALGRYAGYGSWKVGLHDGRLGHRARGRDQRARRMKAALVRCRSARGRRGHVRTRRRGRRQRPPRLACRRNPRGSSRSPPIPPIVRGGENYTSAIAVADRGPLHLEARYNYESVGARSAFVGWTFSGGEAITWELTPLLGGAWGTTQAFVPGAGGERGLEAARLLHRGRIRARQPASGTTAISMPGASWAFGRSNGFASALPANAPGPTAATAISSAGRSRR